LFAFFALAYGLSWAWAIPLAATASIVRRGHGWPTHYPSLVAPAVAAIVVIGRTQGRPGLADLARRALRWRVGVRWWCVAISPAAFLAVALLVSRAMGEQLPSLADFGQFSGTPTIGVLGAFLLITCVGSAGEEIGWRGYALPELQRRCSPLKGTLVLAVLWYLWHLPQFFVLATFRDFSPTEYVGMCIGLICGAVVLTWLHNRSGCSVLLVIVWHGVYNFVGATAASTGPVAAIVTTLVMVQGATLAVAEVRARRSGRPSVIGPLGPP